MKRVSVLTGLVAFGTVALGAGALLALSGLVRADEPATRKTLDRTEDLVVLTGAELPKLKGLPGEHLRVYASRDGKLAPIPFQFDERTPELEYCWRTGPDPVKDVDDGRVDDDDELAFRAADTGDRTAESVPGASARVEVEVAEPDSDRRAWVYVLAFDDKEHAPPARSAERHVEVVPEGRFGARLRTDFFEVASVGSPGLAGRPLGIRFRAKDGSPGPELVKDASRFKLHASYLHARIDREGSEARSALGSSYIDGPVRIVAPVTLEAYLIWGNWISSSRSFVVLHDHTWELHARFSVPVNLDRDHPSEASLAFEPGDAARSWRSLKANGLLQLLGAEGAIGGRLELEPRLSAKAGAEPELAVDLTGLRKSDEATPYEISYVLAVVPGGSESTLPDLFKARDKPLRHAAR